MGPGIDFWRSSDGGASIYSSHAGRWVLAARIENMLPTIPLVGLIRYYTAKIDPEFPSDTRPQRQMKFIQALAASQKVKIKFGTFSHHLCGGA